MKKVHIFLIITLILISFILGFTINKLWITTGKAISQEPQEAYQKTLTKAICDNQNEKCIDLKIECLNNIPVKLQLSSDMVQMPENWQDSRNLTNLCE